MFHNRRMMVGAIRRPVAAAAIGTDPPSIFGANLIGWWDAADGLAGNIAPDRVTAAPHNLTAWLAGITVGTDAGSFGGAPFYEFSSGKYLAAGSALGDTAFPNIGSAGAVFIALSPSATSGDYARTVSISTVHDYDNLNSITAYYLTPSSSAAVTSSVGVTCNSVGVLSTTGVTLADTDYLHCYAWDSANMYIYQNDVLRASGSAGGTINIAASGLALTVGSSVDGSGPFVGRMPFIFIVNVTPSPAQRTALYNYYLANFT